MYHRKLLKIILTTNHLFNNFQKYVLTFYTNSIVKITEYITILGHVNLRTQILSS